MRRIFRSAAVSVALALGLQTAWAHHSFAVYDFQTQIEFKGKVATLNFKNPHIAMTMTVIGEDGKPKTIEFIEGAPANMLARKGLRPDMIAPGTEITAYGSPLNDDPTKFFLRRIRTDDGTEYGI